VLRLHSLRVQRQVVPVRLLRQEATVRLLGLHSLRLRQEATVRVLRVQRQVVPVRLLRLHSLRLRLGLPRALAQQPLRWQQGLESQGRRHLVPLISGISVLPTCREAGSLWRGGRGHSPVQEES
jgi:hypothetical protein